VPQNCDAFPAGAARIAEQHRSVRRAAAGQDGKGAPGPFPHRPPLMRRRQGRSRSPDWPWQRHAAGDAPAGDACLPAASGREEMGRGERLRDFMAPAMTRPEAASSQVRFRPIRSVGGQISREITGMRGGVFSFSGKYGKIWSWPKRSIYGKNEIINYHIYVEVRFDGRDRRRKLLYGNHTRR